MFINIVYFICGGGHLASANALSVALQIKHPAVRIKVIDLRTIGDSVDYIKKVLGIEFESIYNWQIKKGITHGLRPQLRVGQWLINLFYQSLYTKLKEFWSVEKPDVIVSVIPNFNKIMADVAKELGIRFITVMTDLEDNPPHFWMEPECTNQIVLAPVNWSRGWYEIPLGRIVPMKGLMVHPNFYRQWGVIKNHHPFGIVVFGGYGSNQMLAIAKSVIYRDLELTYVCGHNQKLRDKIMDLKTPHRKTVMGYSDNIAYLMQAADFVICKPGPGIISEAVISKTPVITSGPAMFQEECNLRWVKETGAGVVLNSFDDITSGIKQVLDNNVVYRANLNKLYHKSVFEVADFVVA